MPPSATSGRNARSAAPSRDGEAELGGEAGKEAQAEGASRPGAGPAGSALRRLIEHGEFLIYVTASVILIVTAAGLLVVAIREMIEQALAGDYVRALLQVLDRALLVLMLAEIIYTVRRIADRLRLEAKPFFIVAIIAAIRRILVITAESTSNVDIQNPHFQAAMLELALLAVMIVALAGAMRLIPKSED